MKPSRRNSPKHCSNFGVVADFTSLSTVSWISTYELGHRVFSKISRTGLVYAIDAAAPAPVERIALLPWHQTAELLTQRTFLAISGLSSRKRVKSIIQSISNRVRLRLTPLSAAVVSRAHLQIAIPAINPNGVGLVAILTKNFLNFCVRRGSDTRRRGCSRRP